MADQQIPPEMLAAMANGGGMAAPAPDPAEGMAHEASLALLQALRVNAGFAAMATDSAGEAKDFAAACLSLAQAIVVLDPNLTSQGEPLDHQIALETARATGQLAIEQQRGANALEQAKAAAAAPTPARSVRVKRDAQGRAQSYEQS